ncbi:hypothetical protein G7K_5697-t1 [Saitoella complicata NRRL Y-17804]|uniref:Transcription initiation factor TFIID subunit 10 n=1 Tax=Saitoella complicata (strain BCRC 22490 / CBS 7301 / JCM 7358 / NBRC 10748 / NRRL Y-17804) TaxID=698492 RepID=A0A0E9NPK1_SAICN|nr:hypothetical protein G7K_5697-t1 [Saitoella complicata NRRL Y-17804]
MIWMRNDGLCVLLLILIFRVWFAPLREGHTPVHPANVQSIPTPTYNQLYNSIAAQVLRRTRSYNMSEETSQNATPAQATAEASASPTTAPVPGDDAAIAAGREDLVDEKEEEPVGAVKEEDEDTEMKEGGAENEEDEGNRVPPPPPGRPDRTLRDFLGKMDTYAPIVRQTIPLYPHERRTRSIPDAVTNHYLSQAGFSTPTPRLSRLLALATQKFVSDLATSAYQHSRIRTSGVSNVGEGAVGVQGGGRRGKERKSVLTMEDLQGAVAEWGVNLKRGEFYR